MKDLKEEWPDTEEPEGFDDIPDGRYQFKIEKAEISESGSSSRLQCNYDYVVVSGEFKGRHIFTHPGLDSAESRGYFRRNLAKIGVDWPEDPEDLPEVLASEVVDAYIEGRVRHKDDFVNVYHTSALDSGDLEEDVEPDDGDDGDDGQHSIGDRVLVPIDNGEYPGKILEIEDGIATVECDDGDVVEIDVKELIAIDEKDGDGGADDGGEEPAEIELGFEEDDLSEADITKISELSAMADFDPDDYNTWTDLLLDLGESVELSGLFKTPKKLILAIGKELK